MAECTSSYEKNSSPDLTENCLVDKNISMSASSLDNPLGIELLCPPNMEGDQDINLTDSPEIVDHYTPHGTKRSLRDDKRRKKLKWTNCNPTCSHTDCGGTPLPFLVWADSKSIWDIMMHKADVAGRSRNCRLFEDTDTISPRMRAILIEWVMEVCEVYRLRRTTYYLAVDYIDRYLSINPVVAKHQLQLIGISALFIAAKFDEIYTPKVSEFAYICDGACPESDILLCERILLHLLSWDINPMTPTAWLSLYMQIYTSDQNSQSQNILLKQSVDEFFIYPQYSAFDFVNASHLIDLFSLDPCFLLFKYNVIAAAAMYFMYGQQCALKVSGLQWKDLESCVEYMDVFYTVIRNTNDPKLDCMPCHVPDRPIDCATYNFLKHRIPNITYGENHSMQTHAVNMDYLEKSCTLRLRKLGFRVTRKLNKIQESEEVAPETDDNANQAEKKGEQGDEALVTFEVEKDESPGSSTSDECTPEFILNSNRNEQGEFIYLRSELSFDDMMERLNEYTIKKVMVPDAASCDETNEVAE